MAFISVSFGVAIKPLCATRIDQGRIKLSTKEFYLILGDDDIFLGNISLINNLLAKSDFDLYVFNVIKNRKVVKGYFPSKLYTTVLGIFPSHTGGMLIKNELHSEFGFYSLKFKVLADQLFLLGCILKNKVIKYESAVISIVGEKGFSSNYDMSILELRKIIHELRLGIVPLCFSYILQCKRRIRNKWGKLKF